MTAQGWPATSEWWLEQLRRWFARRTRRLVARVGRRGGKSTLVCRLAVAHVLFGRHVLPPGTRGVFIILSVNMKEAAERLFTLARILDTLGIRYEQNADELRLVGLPLLFRVYAARVAAVGMTCIGLVADELSRWRDDATGANPATEVLGSVRPAMADQPSAIEMLISSPWSTLDAHYEAMARGDTADQTVCEAPTWVARPDLSEAMTRALEPDEPTWAREYGAVPMTSTGASVFDAAAVRDSVDRDLVLPVLPRPGLIVTAGGDWGFRRNASAVAVCHVESGRYTLADSLELQPKPGEPLRPSEVAKQAAAVLRRQASAPVMVDAHYREAMVEHLLSYGVRALDAPTDVAATYVRARTLFAHGQVRIPDNRNLIRDLLEVQQRPTAGGGLSIVLPKRPGGSHADLVAALVLALWQQGGVSIEAPEADPQRHLEPATRADYDRMLADVRARQAEADGWGDPGDYGDPF